MKRTFTIAGSALVLVLAGCASAPSGPSVMALPGSGKSETQFRYDDYHCREYAQSQIDPNAASNAGVRDAALGTAIGAVVGAAVGGHHGAAVGAGTGLVAGSLAGANDAQYAAYGTQRQYDHAYVQCMYAKGQRVPVSGALAPAPAARPPAYYPPPPPPGWRP